MAGGVVLPDVKLNDGGRLTVYVLFACIVAASGGLLFGYDIGVTGGVTSNPGFLQSFYPSVYSQEQSAESSAWCKYDNQLLQLFTSSLFLAGIFGSLLSSFTTSHFGRVRTMLLGGLFFLIGAALTASAINNAMLVIGRVMLGLGVGSANQAVPLYLSEMSPSRYRGALNIMFQMATTLGILAGQLVNFGVQNIQPWGWRISLGIAGIPAAILTIGGIFLPETPSSLIDRGLLEKGREILTRIRGTWDVQDEYQYILAASEEAKAAKSASHSILSLNLRPQLTWAILIPMFQQLTGINAIMFYVTPLFSSLGFGANASLYATVITGAVNVLATIVSIVTVDRFGRKFLFLIGGCQMFICQIVMATLLAIYFGDGYGQMPDSVAVVIVVVICAYVAAFAWSWGPLGWLVPSEIQPLETRSIGQSITVSTNFLFSFAIGQAFLSMLCTMTYGIFLFFAGWIMVMTAAVYFFLPETKGLAMDNTMSIWANHWYWRRIVRGSSVEPMTADSEKTFVALKNDEKDESQVMI